MEHDKIRISSELSGALDIARAAAAIYVVFHHVLSKYTLPYHLDFIFRFGQEAVLVFFLLSGFVIFASESQRANDLRGYYLRRIRRIYPPLIAALLVSTYVAWSNGILEAQFSATQLAGTLLSLQDISFLKPGVITDPYLGNSPLWSLSYEVFFYSIYPFVFWLWKKNRSITNNILGFICCTSYIIFIIYPQHFTLVLAYFLVWWCGAMAADSWFRQGRDVRSMMSSYKWLVALCVTAAIGIMIEGFKGVGVHPFLEFRHFSVGALVLLIFTGSNGALVRRLSPLNKLGIQIASISYGLYILHYPLLVQWHVTQTHLGFALACVLLFCLSYLVERQLPRLLPKVPQTSVAPVS